MQHSSPRRHYQRGHATGYEAARTNEAKWRIEQRIVADLLDSADVTNGVTVLDVPVGTGRFLPLYRERGARAIGVDISPDMLAEARRKVNGGEVDLRVGDITALELDDNAVEVAVCVRLLNLIDASTMDAAMVELGRVARRAIIVGIRTDPGSWSLTLRQRLGRVRRAVRHAVRPYRALPHRHERWLSALRSWLVEAALEVEVGRDGSRYIIYLLRSQGQ